MLQLLILYDFVPQPFTYQIIDKYIYVKSILGVLVILGKCLLKCCLHMSDKQFSRNLWQISNCGKMHIREMDYVQIIFRNIDVTTIYTNARQQTSSFPV